MFADRAEVGGEESAIAPMIRARMRGKVCRTTATASKVVWFRGRGSRVTRGQAGGNRDIRYRGPPS